MAYSARRAAGSAAFSTRAVARRAAEYPCRGCRGLAAKASGQSDRWGARYRTEVLEYVPASFKVIWVVRPECACAFCDAILQAKAPGRPIAGGLAGPGAAPTPRAALQERRRPREAGSCGAPTGPAVSGGVLIRTGP